MPASNFVCVFTGFDGLERLDCRFTDWGYLNIMIGPQYGLLSGTYAITWSSVLPDLWHHVVSLGQNEWKTPCAHALNRSNLRQLFYPPHPYEIWNFYCILGRGPPCKFCRWSDIARHLGHLLLTWINFNPCLDRRSIIKCGMKYPFSKLQPLIEVWE